MVKEIYESPGKVKIKEAAATSAVHANAVPSNRGWTFRRSIPKNPARSPSEFRYQLCGPVGCSSYATRKRASRGRRGKYSRVRGRDVEA